MFSPFTRTSLVGALAFITALTSASGQSWQQTLTGSTTSEFDQFGLGLAFSDGQLLVGSPRDDTSGVARGSGSVTIFSHGLSGWTEDELLVPPVLTLNGYFGTSLSLDGGTLLVGAPGVDSPAAPATGLVHIFERVAGAWSLTGELEVSDLVSGDRFGYAVALDGDWAAVGAMGRDANGWNSGCVFMFHKTPMGWVEDARLYPATDSAGARFGQSVALLGDTLVVGAPEDSRPVLASGCAYVFTRDEQNEWSMRTELSGEGQTEFQRFGASIAIEAGTIVIGAPGSYAPFGDSAGTQSTHSPGPPRGDAWVFHKTAGEWAESQRLRAPAGDRGDLFGQRVYLAEGRLNVSAGGRPTGEGREGATFLYEASGSGWFLTQEITDPSPSPSLHFGSVAVHANDELFVSSIFDGFLGAQSGCVHVFQLEAPSHQYCYGESCPCGNDDLTAGCMNSTGVGAELFALGTASLTEDDLIIRVRGLPARTPTLVFVSDGAGQAFFGDGILCLGAGNLSRLGRLGHIRRASSDGEVEWGPGLFDTPGTATMADRLYLQAIYRDPYGVCGTGINFSNALEFERTP